MIANIITAEMGLKDVTSEFTLNSTDITFDNSATKIFENKNIIFFTLRGQFGNNISAGALLATIPQKYAPATTLYFAMFDTNDWNNPTIHGIMTANATSIIMGVSGAPNLNGKKFVVSGSYPII